MKILNAGTENLSNLDVLNWIASKRHQHAVEDAAERARGYKPISRPQNFLDSLDKHEAELSTNKYPYKKNPTAYPPNRRYVESMSKFNQLMTERIMLPLEERYRGKGMSLVELNRTLGKKQEAKALSETEQLMLLNLAPVNVEMLKPMIENVDERFSAEEQEVIVQCVREVYRCDEYGGEAVDEG